MQLSEDIKERRTRFAGHCYRANDEIISVVALWNPTHGKRSVVRPPKTLINQLCDDVHCNPEDLPNAMNDRDEWRVKVKNIRAISTSW